jgi:hypothetical protein
LADLGAIVKKPQVKILVLERPPGPLNENVACLKPTTDMKNIPKTLKGSKHGKRNKII